MLEITQAFIFCAGRGERMRPFTDTIPKPLVKINGKAILDYSLEKINKISSIKKIIVNGFYLANQVEKHLQKSNNSKIIFSHEEEKIETGGALIFAKKYIDYSQPLLLINGDVLWQEKNNQSDIELLCKHWNSEAYDLLLGLKKTDQYHGFERKKDGTIGDFNFENNQLFRFSNQSMTHAYVGLQIINPAILSTAPSKCFSMSHYFYAKINENGLLERVGGVELLGEYFHIGNVEAVSDTEEKLNRLSRDASNQ